MNRKIEENYNSAKEYYNSIGIDVEEKLQRLKDISISIQCWQGDDVGGFETPGSVLSGGGIQVTGNHVGKARSISELQEDMEKVFSLIPGNHRYNLHAIYGDFAGEQVDRDEIEPKHFAGWVEWARKNNLKLDFKSNNSSVLIFDLAPKSFRSWL